MDDPTQLVGDQKEKEDPPLEDLRVSSPSDELPRAWKIMSSHPIESTPVHLKQFSPKGVDPQFVLESTLTLLESTPAKQLALFSYSTASEDYLK
ncbi:hypothetical protein Taro_049034 [Colocasia esculenta]|uniref:Uncharacterized protein n=1 Tax=Colocasia esculenta TaxID=4460 RepID=A0A843X9Y5_COLES|nr:hypothetical protein [Colocasia esculenta]